jgi:hypothetical protein
LQQFSGFCWGMSGDLKLPQINGLDWVQLKVRVVSSARLCVRFFPPAGKTCHELHEFHENGEDRQ